MKRIFMQFRFMGQKFGKTPKLSEISRLPHKGVPHGRADEQNPYDVAHRYGRYRRGIRQSERGRVSYKLYGADRSVRSGNYLRFAHPEAVCGEFCYLIADNPRNCRLNGSCVLLYAQNKPPKNALLAHHRPIRRFYGETEVVTVKSGISLTETHDRLMAPVSSMGTVNP